MGVSHRHGGDLISGVHLHGNGGLGVLGSEVPSTGTHGPGYLYNDLTFPADANKEVRGVILTVPSSGTFFAYEDSSFSLIGAADGSYTFTYALYVDGAYMGDATGYITVGASGTLYQSRGRHTTGARMGSRGL